MLKQNTKHYLIIDASEDLSIKNLINSIVSRQKIPNLYLSELIEMVQDDFILLNYYKFLIFLIKFFKK